MIKEISLSNINQIVENSLIKKKTIIEDLSNNPFGKYLILINDNDIIGYLYYSDIYDRAEINQIEILENHRNCGKGSLLLQKMIDIVEKNITLEVKKDNYCAIKLYEKFGFKKIAIRKQYYQNTDGILMERKHI